MRSLQDLGDNPSKRIFYFSSKNGNNTIASKHRKRQSFDAEERKKLASGTLELHLNFEQRFQLQKRELQMLELRREISQKHRKIRELEMEMENKRRH